MSEDNKLFAEIFDAVLYLFERYRYYKGCPWVEDAKCKALYNTWQYFDDIRLAKRRKEKE